MTQPLHRATVVGAGSIGAGWVATFLAAGLDVSVVDPADGSRNRVRATIASSWPALERLGLAEGASPDRVTFSDDLAAAIADTDFVQESGPEDLAAKQALVAAIDAVAAPDVVIASSTSGVLPSDLQATAAQPGRVLVGHPFNPTYLVPVVEVVPGQATEAWAVDRAVDVYTRMGKQPLVVRRELPGHVVNRLQAALWREAYWLVREGVASVADIDRAIAWGPGPRWALMGPFATQHLSGGGGGLAAVLEHLGPPMAAWWDSLQQPPWDDQTVDAALTGLQEALGEHDVDELRARRDDLLERLLHHKSVADLP